MPTFTKRREHADILDTYIMVWRSSEALQQRRLWGMDIAFRHVDEVRGWS